jgi:hypothetical protein
MEQELSALDLQRQGAAKKQILYRDVNERIESLAEAESSAVFVCECPQDECDKRVSLPLEQYEEIRSSPQRFFVLPGHQLAEVNDIVDATDRYLVVENRAVGFDSSSRSARF